MFNFQGSEIVIIMLLALVVLGPEKLPEAMRKLGEFYSELKKMSSSFQKEFSAAIDEPVRELRDTAKTLRDSADFTKFAAGDREEKPKSAEMVAAPDPNVTPTDEVPFDTPDHDVRSPEPNVGTARPSPNTPQVAVDDEFGLREARPADEPAEPSTPQVAVDDEFGLREARPADEPAEPLAEAEEQS